MMTNCRFDHVSPACTMRTLIGGFFSLFCRVSRSLIRFFHLLAARALRVARGGNRARSVGARQAFLALLRLPLAGQDRIDEHPDDAASGDGHEEKQRDRL